jgi:hypothetical protein
MQAVETIEEANTQPSQWWRWPLMPFASVLGATVGAFLFTLLQWVGLKFQGGFAPEGWAMMYLLPLISSATFGFLYTWIACTMAPKAKFITGVVMVTILGVFSLVAVLFTWAASTYSIGKAVFETLRLVAWMVTAVGALADFRGQ